MAGSAVEFVVTLLGDFAIVQVAKSSSPDRVKAHMCLALAAATVRKALAVATVLLVAAFYTAGPYATVQVAEPVALGSFLAPFVHTPLTTTVRTTEAAALRRLAASSKTAARAATVAFTESIGLCAFIAPFHSAWLALDPATVLVEEGAGLAEARAGHSRLDATVGHRNTDRTLLHQCCERRRVRNLNLLDHTSRHDERRAEGGDGDICHCGVCVAVLLLSGEAAHDGVDEVLVPEHRTERGPVLGPRRWVRGPELKRFKKRSGRGILLNGRGRHLLLKVFHYIVVIANAWQRGSAGSIPGARRHGGCGRRRRRAVVHGREHGGVNGRVRRADARVEHTVGGWK